MAAKNLFNDMTNKGFTLLEILLVVLILSIMTAAGVNVINSQSIERVIINQAEKIKADIQFICEKSVLENQAYGVEFLSNAYQVLRYQQPGWLLVETQAQAQIHEGVQLGLLLDGSAQDLEVDTLDADENLPHIICQTDGSFNPFELRLSAAAATVDANSNEADYYVLNSTSPWQLTGTWYQP